MTDPYDEAFANAVFKLNRKRLSSLWKISSLWSSLDYFGSWTRPSCQLFPMLNLVKINMLDKAILASTATEYKSESLVGAEIPYVVNNLVFAIDVPVQVDPDVPKATSFLQAFGSMAVSQFALQARDATERLGRTYAFLDRIPFEHESRLKQRHGKAYIDIAQIALRDLGLSVKDFLMIGFGVIALHMDRYQKHLITAWPLSEELARLERMGSGLLADEEATKILGKLTEQAPSLDGLLTFTVRDILHGHPAFTQIKVARFLDVASRSTRQLRETARLHDEYAIGNLADRLSPLQRYPIVRLDPNRQGDLCNEDTRFIVPNFRYFDTALTNILHYELQARHPGDEYNQMLGSIQEIYIADLISAQQPELRVIPETQYRKRGQAVHGPDLTLLDVKNNALIAVESKAKRLSLRSRLNPVGDFSREEYGAALKALRRLPHKIDDMFDHFPEYDTYRADLRRVERKKCVCVIVLGEGMAMMQSFLVSHLHNEPTHFLWSYPYPYCVLDVMNFERCIEIANVHGTSLYELLLEYRSAEAEKDIAGIIPEAFQGRGLDHPPPFARSFMDQLFDRTMPKPQ